MRVLEVAFDPAHEDTVAAVVEQAEALDVQRFAERDDARRLWRVLVRRAQAQALTDRLQTVLGGSDGWRITVLPVEATMPAVTVLDRRGATSSREELVEDVADGADLGANFVLLTTLSVVLAWIGLSEDNLAVIIGAMVIAPLLGPNLALSVGAALGHRGLILDAVRANAAGLALTVAIAAALGWFFGIDASVGEIASRTRVGPSDVVLAAVAGAAGVLSLTTGLSSGLVGVMVAVALMPPAVVAGSLLGAGQTRLATGALLLLAVNVVCVNLASQVVLIAKGIRPRTGLEQRAAGTAVRLNVAAWVLLLVLIAVLTLIGAGR